MTIKEIKKRIREIQKEIVSATGIIAVQLENELETLIFLKSIKGV